MKDSYKKAIIDLNSWKNDYIQLLDRKYSWKLYDIENNLKGKLAMIKYEYDLNDDGKVIKRCYDGSQGYKCEYPYKEHKGGGFIKVSGQYTKEYLDKLEKDLTVKYY